MAKVYTVQRGNSWQYYFEGAKIGGKRTRIQKCGFATEKEAEAAGVKALFELIIQDKNLKFLKSVSAII